MDKVGIRLIVKGYFAIMDMSGYRNIGQGTQAGNGGDVVDEINRVIENSCDLAFRQCMDPDPYPITPLLSQRLSGEWRIGFYVGADCPKEGKALRALVYAASLIQGYALTHHGVVTSGIITKGEMDAVCSAGFGAFPSEVCVNDGVNLGEAVQAFDADLVDGMVNEGILLVSARGEKYVNVKRM